MLVPLAILVHSQKRTRIQGQNMQNSMYCYKSYWAGKDGWLHTGWTVAALTPEWVDQVLA